MALSPRTKLAARLYATGAARTIKEAAGIAGIHPVTLSGRLQTEPRMAAIASDIEHEMTAGIVDMSRVLQRLGRKALVNMEQLMDDGSKEEIRFRATQDLLDRSPETSKTQKLQLEGDFVMTQEQIETLTRALVESAEASQEYAAAADGDYVTADGEHLSRHLQLIAGVDSQVSADVRDPPSG